MTDETEPSPVAQLVDEAKAEIEQRKPRKPKFGRLKLPKDAPKRALSLDKRGELVSAREQIARRGGRQPVEDLLVLRDMWWAIVEHQEKLSDRRRDKQLLATGRREIREIDTTLLQFTDPKLTAVQQQIQAEVKQLVIRAPAVCSSNEEWLARFGPDGSENIAPRGPTVIQQFNGKLQQSLDIADATGVTDAAVIMDEARKAMGE